MEIVVASQNNITKTFTVTGTTAVLVLSGENLWDWGLTDLIRIKDTTTGATFGLAAGVTFSNTFASGLPTYTWNLTQIPAGTASGDTILVYMNVTEPQASLSLLQYQKA